MGEVVARNGTLPTLAPVADITEEDKDTDESEDCDSRVGSKSGCKEVVARNGTLPTLAPVAEVDASHRKHKDKSSTKHEKKYSSKDHKAKKKHKKLRQRR